MTDFQLCRSFRALVAGLALASASCTAGPTPSDELWPATPPPRPRFSHAQHAQTECAPCHDPKAVIAGRAAQPGAADHAPCDQGKCHRDDFLQPPGELCDLCHAKVDPTGATPVRMAPYPPEHGPRHMAAEFSHTLHLSYDRMEAAVGFHVTCTDCHTGDPDGRQTLPGHAACYRCHAPESAPHGAPAIGDCRGCHHPRKRPPPRSRQLIQGDLRFDHREHETDRKGKPIRCVECHTKISSVGAVEATAVPPTSACVACHDDADRTPSITRMRQCQTCHLTRRVTFRTLAPRSHLPAAEIPVNHTLAFRSDHAVDARANSRDCARCHDQMSGGKSDTCDECHQVMKPRDHTVEWREFEHGPASASVRDRCPTCHEGGFCVACHARPPRSHFPLPEFSRRGHAELAAIDLRACGVCHAPARDCAGLGCHALGAPGP